MPIRSYFSLQISGSHTQSPGLGLAHAGRRTSRCRKLWLRDAIFPRETSWASIDITMEAITLRHPEHPHSRSDIARVPAYIRDAPVQTSPCRSLAPLWRLSVSFHLSIPSRFLLFQNYTRYYWFICKKFRELRFENRIAVYIFCQTIEAFADSLSLSLISYLAKYFFLLHVITLR